MVLIFPHIPKTGGLSFYYEIAKVSDSVIRFGDDRSVNLFNNSTLKNFKEYWFLTGHISYQKFKKKGFNGPAFTITREPITRLISMYRYLNRSQHPDHEKLKFSNSDSFIDWLLEIPGYCNLQCSYITESATFDKAIKVINNENILICPLEQYSDLIQYFSSLLDCNFEVSHRNKSPKKDYLEFTESQISRLEPFVSEDRKLHNYALENYEQLKLRFTQINQDSFYEFRQKVRKRYSKYRCEVIKVNCLENDLLYGWNLERPTSGMLNSDLFSGWIIGKKSSVVSIELRKNNQLLKLISINLNRPDVAHKYSDIIDAESSGFRTSLTDILNEHESLQSVDIILVFENREKILLGKMSLIKVQ